MSTFVEIKNAIDQVGQSFDAYKDTNDKRIQAIKDGNETLAKELDQKLSRIENDVQQFTKIKQNLEIEQQLNRERLEELEARASNPAKNAAQKKKDEYKETFVNWLHAKGQSA